METKTIKVLIIDDEIEICYLIAKILRKRGIESFFVYSLSEARAILKTYHPNLIFLDNHLPDGLGVDFTSYLKDNFPATKVIIITGHDVNMTLVLNEIVSEVVLKPFSTEKLYSIIDQYT